MKRELRRYEDRLIVTGSGIFVVGLWSVVKFAMIYAFGQLPEFSNEIMAELGESETLVLGIVLFITLVLLMLSHLYIGRSAQNEGLRKSTNKWGYIVFTVLFTVLYGISVSDDIRNLDIYYDTAFDGIVETIIDITVLVTLVELIIAAVEVKYLRYKISKQEKSGYEY